MNMSFSQFRYIDRSFEIVVNGWTTDSLDRRHSPRDPVLTGGRADQPRASRVSRLFRAGRVRSRSWSLGQEESRRFE